MGTGLQAINCELTGPRHEEGRRAQAPLLGRAVPEGRFELPTDSITVAGCMGPRVAVIGWGDGPLGAGGPADANFYELCSSMLSYSGDKSTLHY